MTSSFKQIAHPKWPSGQNRPIAVLNLEPAEISARYGIRFTVDRDDLDFADVATVELGSGRHLIFVRYRNHPSPGTEVGADLEDDWIEARQELLQALRLDRSAVTWMADESRGVQGS